MFDIYFNDELHDQVVIRLSDFVDEYDEYEEFDEWYDKAMKLIYKFHNYEGFSVDSPQKHLYFISLDSWNILIRNKDEDKKTLKSIESYLIDKFDDLEREIEDFIEYLDENEDEDDEY